MDNQIFISPAVKFYEKDVSFISKSLGLTSLGLVGETLKGPAFQPILCTTPNEFLTKFGGQSIEKLSGSLKFPLPYTANAFLGEADSLYVTRVLGKTGYNAGTGWAITVQANADVSTATSGVTTTFNNVSFTGTQLSQFPFITNVSQVTGVTVTGTSNYSKNITNFTATGVSITTVTYDVTAQSGTCNYTTTIFNALPYEQYDNMVVATIRSRADYSLNDLTFRTSSVYLTGFTSNLFDDFNIVASSSASTETYMVSLLDTSRSYINRVLGVTAKDKTNKLYVESSYPELIKKLANDGLIYAVNPNIVRLSTPNFVDYTEGFQTPSTPYVVSELRGNSVEKLFRFVSISDGNSANQEIKISIQNIDPSTGYFDVLIRDFNDTDASIIVLESYTRCSMRKDDSTFIGRRIGAVDSNGDESYDILSSYVYLELNDNASDDSFPAGFEGYFLRDYSSINTGSISATTPSIFYKQAYNDYDKIRKVYLGISENAYGFSSGFNKDYFNYSGKVKVATTFHKTKGFHLDKDATGTYDVGQFSVGAGSFKTATDLLVTSNPYSQKNTAKFTLVPYGGFDGWDEHRSQRTVSGIYKKGKSLYLGTDTADFYAYSDGIDTFRNKEQVSINLYAMPGINWDDHIDLINLNLEMIEEDRQDAFYVIDAPDVPNTAGLAQEYADKFDSANLDSSWCATYAPWGEISDTQNSANVFLPGTGEALSAMAFTDKNTFPWDAPAGLNRGVTNFKRVRRKLNLTERDILYKARINPIVSFNDTGVVIFGQKTTQFRESALDRINVRRLLIRTRQLIANISNKLLFEQNDQALRDEFLQKINPLLEQIKRDRGLTEFKVIVDSTNNGPEVIDRKQLNCVIMLKPTPAVEFINIGFIVTSQGVSFNG